MGIDGDLKFCTYIKNMYVHWLAIIESRYNQGLDQQDEKTLCHNMSTTKRHDATLPFTTMADQQVADRYFSMKALAEPLNSIDIL